MLKSFYMLGSIFNYMLSRVPYVIRYFDVKLKTKLTKLSFILFLINKKLKEQGLN